MMVFDSNDGIHDQPTCQLYPDGCLKSILYAENPCIPSGELT